MLSPRDALILLAVAMMAIVAPTLLSSKADSGEDVAFYCPQRVMRQLSYDKEQ